MEAKAVGRLTLQQLVSEIGSFQRPSLWNIRSLELNLSPKNRITNFLPTSPNIRPPSGHELIHNHP
jgi:hypothetical protein